VKFPEEHKICLYQDRVFAVNKKKSCRIYSYRTKYRILVAVALEGSPLSRMGEISRVLGILSCHPNLRWAKDFISCKQRSRSQPQRLQHFQKITVGCYLNPGTH